MAYKTLADFMKALTASRRGELRAEVLGKDSRSDLFTCLVRASDGESKFGLPDEDLVRSGRWPFQVIYVTEVR